MAADLRSGGPSAASLLECARLMIRYAWTRYTQPNEPEASDWDHHGYVRHVAEGQRTLCGLDVGTRSQGWARDPDALVPADLMSITCDDCRRRGQSPA